MSPGTSGDAHVFTADTVWTGGIRTSTSVRGHQVIADGPLWRFGTDDGPAPGELLLASVGACLVNHLVRYMQYKRTTVEAVSARVTGAFRYEGELEIFDSFSFDVTVEAPTRLSQMVEKAFKVAQKECTLLRILDVKKSFELSFVPSD